jgi:hypothetical protein
MSLSPLLALGETVLPLDTMTYYKFRMNVFFVVAAAAAAAVACSWQSSLHSHNNPIMNNNNNDPMHRSNSRPTP